MGRILVPKFGIALSFVFKFNINSVPDDNCFRAFEFFDIFPTVTLHNSRETNQVGSPLLVIIKTK